MGKWTRRAFLSAGLLTGGGIIVGVAIRPGNRSKKLESLVSASKDVLIDAWVKIKPDNSVTIIVPHAEMGQGVHTALPLMLAEELDLDWSTVSVEEAPAHPEYVTSDLARDFVMPQAVPALLEDSVKGFFMEISQFLDLQITGGSYSVRATGERSMRVAGASIRQLFIEAAADMWGVSVSEITTKDSHLYHEQNKRKAAYVDFAETIAHSSLPSKPRLKSISEFKLMGRTDIQRLDIPAKVDGSAKFGIDIELPNMKYATVKAAPVFGAKVANYDSKEALKLAGVHKVVDLGNAIGVIADGYWVAKNALNLVSVTFSMTGFESADSISIFKNINDQLNAAERNADFIEDIAKGDVPTGLKSAAKVVEAQYQVPYLAHATMEPMNCTALIEGDKLTVWTGTQSPLGVRNALADEFDFRPQDVSVLNQYLGGGFGRRADTDYSMQAVKLAKAMPGVPIKLIWSREEDTQHDHYRQAMISRFKAGLDNKGGVTAWHNQYHDKHDPVEAPHIPYHIDNQQIEYIDYAAHVPFGPWRSVDHSAHAFFTESFIDELAISANADPFRFRFDFLSKQPRMQKVLETAANMSGWGQELPSGWGRGIAIHKSFGTIVAQVVTVQVADGKVNVKEVDCVADPGFAVCPDGFKAQMESGIAYGLTAALFGEISIENGAVKQSNFHDYKMLRMFDSPTIEVAIINSGKALGGGGEPATPPIAPALTNAIFAAVGKRIRSLPVNSIDSLQS